MKKKLLAMLLTVAMVSALVGCGASADTTETEPAATEEAAEETTEEVAEEPATEEAAADGQTYTIGICQLVQHPALDRLPEAWRHTFS